MKVTSGSVIGPLVAAELLKRDQNVICIVVGNTCSVIPTRNTLNTMKSLDGVARTAVSSMIMLYAHNSAETSVEQVNKQIMEHVSAIGSLFSGSHGHIDSQDLYNWLHFHKVTAYEPGLACLEIVLSKPGTNAFNQLSQLVPIASMVTLSKNQNERYILGDDDAEYHTFGVFNPPDSTASVGSMHFVLTTHELPNMIGDLESRLATLQDNLAAKRRQKVLVNNSDDDGMVV